MDSLFKQFTNVKFSDYAGYIVSFWVRASCERRIAFSEIDYLS